MIIRLGLLRLHENTTLLLKGWVRWFDWEAQPLDVRHPTSDLGQAKVN